MRFLLSVLLLLGSMLYAQAQETKPNTLTPKEIADGWILLFDGQTTFGWKVDHSTEKKTPKIIDGVLDLSPLGGGIIGTTSAFAEFELRFEYQSTLDNAHVWIKGNEKGAGDALALRGPRNEWTPVTLRVGGGQHEFDSEGVKSSSPWQTRAAEIHFRQGGSSLRVRNIKLKSLNTKSLFNGKDLTGWHEFPGKKSKFTVTDKGEINLKNGPGDLQTVGKYQDFILQLECISNGKHLNSGVFFRCRANEYQNGYEAQIRNQFTPEPTQEYVLEEYDPRTKQLDAKKKVKYTAVDYGTGAIYRRQPARKVVAKDGQWFTLTILAHGNHMATWVDGIQVTDWFDNRPKSDNARTGCRLEGGHISLQGHDPTTDLSFRNFRIAELK